MKFNIKNILILFVVVLVIIMFTKYSNNKSINEQDNTNIQQDENTEREVENMSIKINVGNESFTATLENNETSKAFKLLLPLTLNMDDVNGNEKYCNLSQSINKDTDKNQGTIQTGDIMCWGSSGLVFFYKTFNTSYRYVKIGQIDDIDGYVKALGRGSVQVTIE